MHWHLTFLNQYWKIICKRASQSRRFHVCFQSVKEQFIAEWKDTDLGLISDDELDRHVTEASKDFPFCGEQMLKFLLKERGIKVQRMRIRIVYTMLTRKD